LAKHIPGYKTASPALYATLKEYAKYNRSNPTLAERLLWQELKKNRYHLKFRRQQIIGDFIVDFVCLSSRLIIEVDGGYHNETQQKIEDSLRATDLSNYSFSILRFTNEEVYDDVHAVAETIYRKIFDMNDNNTTDDRNTIDDRNTTDDNNTTDYISL